MKTSIVLATYNGGKYIEEQLISLFNQTRLADEIVISDDGSNDNTKELILELIKNAPCNVKYLHNDGVHGYTGNFNNALLSCSGDLIFLCDQDDVWFENKLDYMYSQALKLSDKLMLMNDALITDINLVTVGLTNLSQMYDAGLSESSYVTGCCSVIKRELLDACLPINSNFIGHDSWIAFFADALDSKVIIPEVLQYYRRHGMNESKSITSRIKKNTRFFYYIDRVKNLVTEISSKQYIHSIKQDELLLDGLYASMHKAPVKLKSKLEDKYFRHKFYHDMRKDLRMRSPISRLFGIVFAWVRGHYSGKHGLRDSLIDMAFNEK